MQGTQTGQATFPHPEGSITVKETDSITFQLRKKKARRPPEAQRKKQVTQRWGAVFEMDLKSETDCPTEGSGEEAGAWMGRELALPQLDGTQSIC